MSHERTVSLEIIELDRQHGTKTRPRLPLPETCGAISEKGGNWGFLHGEKGHGDAPSKLRREI
tara:strand:- start:245 stop:433 length:189 start_codon:yes stop_codon:yes gene_type:complete